jgi:hypothetical protein
MGSGYGRSKWLSWAARMTQTWLPHSQPASLIESGGYKLTASASNGESYIHQFSVKPVSRQLAADTDRPEPLNEWFALLSPTEDCFRFARYPPGVSASVSTLTSIHTKALQSQLDDVSFESLRRSEPPSAVVHETICEQAHWSVVDAMP